MPVAVQKHVTNNSCHSHVHFSSLYTIFVNNITYTGWYTNIALEIGEVGWNKGKKDSRLFC